MYEPHVSKWAEKAHPSTVLWFWNTELGWATTHNTIEKYGWKYYGCNIWNKGIGHVAGNCNGKTMRSFPVVTEVCVQYVRDPNFIKTGGVVLTIQEWLRSEWKRTGMPLSRANVACGVKNAATRKYLTVDHLFYLPPQEVFNRLQAYANEFGCPEGRPYFNLPDDIINWEHIRHKWHFEYGTTNVWEVAPVRGKERMKLDQQVIHLNQKPLSLMKRIIRAVCNPGDIIWEPFAGLASASVAAIQSGCRPFAAELNDQFCTLADLRLKDAVKERMIVQWLNGV